MHNEVMADVVLCLVFGGGTWEVELAPVGDSSYYAFVAEDLEAGVATDAVEVSMGRSGCRWTYSLMAWVLPGRT